MMMAAKSKLKLGGRWERVLNWGDLRQRQYAPRLRGKISFGMFGNSAGWTLHYRSEKVDGGSFIDDLYSAVKKAKAACDAAAREYLEAKEGGE